jgi:aldose 1-epimerase
MRAAIKAIPAAELWTYTSLNGEEGFLGALRLEVLTALLGATASDALRAPHATAPESAYALGGVLLGYRAALAPGSAGPTPIKLTRHWGFTLDASLNAHKAKAKRDAAAYGLEIDLVRTYTLHMAANAVLALDADNDSAGTLDDVTGPGHDCCTPKPIATGMLKRGYDDFHAFASPAGLTAGKSRLPLVEEDKVSPLLASAAALGESVVSLLGAKGGLSAEFWTNRASRSGLSGVRRADTRATEPGVQFHMANFYDRSNAHKKIYGGSGAKAAGDGYGPHAGAFLKFHAPLAAFLAQDANVCRRRPATLPLSLFSIASSPAVAICMLSGLLNGAAYVSPLHLWERAARGPWRGGR